MEEPQVIFEDEDFIVINKPSGLIVHPVRASEWDKELSVVSWAVRRYPEMKSVGDAPEVRPGVVHRLDRGTSGVMLLARTQHGFEYLKSLFQTRTIKKTYRAIVQGIPKEKSGVIDTPIGIIDGTVKRSVRASTWRREAVTEYKTEASFEKEGEKSFSLVEARPLTGRTHQIRVHFASIHHPIAGDPLYGPKLKPAWATRLMLHAFSLELGWQGRRAKFEAEPPEDFKKVLEILS